MNKEITIIAVKAEMCGECIFCACACDIRALVDAGLPDCDDGYVYKIKEDTNESISNT